MSPPPPEINKILLHALVFYHYTYHIQMTFLISGGKAVKRLKNLIMILAHQIPDFNNFVQACSSFIYTFFMAELGLVMSGKSLSSDFQPNNPVDM